MRYADIIECDVVNGVGISCTLFVQGCSHHCEGCFNQQSWDFNGGREFTNQEQKDFLNSCQKSFIDNISILGGEPLDQPDDFLEYIKSLKLCVGKPIYMWTGYTYEEIIEDTYKKQYLEFVDVLIDGEFQKDKKTLTMHLRGSTNQRVIDVKKSLQQNKIVKLEE